MHPAPDTETPAACAWYAANAYKLSETLFALLDAGVLERLAAAGGSAHDLAADLALDPAALVISLDLMARSGIVTRAAESFALAPGISALLPLLRLEGALSAAHIRRDSIGAALRGLPPGDPMEQAAAAALWPTYLEAMAGGARALAPHLARLLRDLPRRRLLDLGGADGALALALTRLLPAATGVVVDRPEQATAFQQRIAPAGANDRLRFVAGDLRRPAALADELAQADALVLSNVLHLLTTAESLELLRVARANLAPGSRVILYDQFVPPAGHLDSAQLMVIDWLLCGYRFADSEQTWCDRLGALGFVAATAHRPARLPGAIVVATAPPRP